jgi:hypothetical protein
MIKREPDDPNAPTTYHEMARASIALDEAGGRFAAARVIGSTSNPAQLYPPASQPMSADVGVEPALGDDLHPGPVGTPAEIEHSIAQLERERERNE